MTVFGSYFLSYGSPMLALDPGEAGGSGTRGARLYRGFTLGTLSMAAYRFSV